MSAADINLASACPPTWQQDEWDGFVLILREWWPEPEEKWTPRRIMGLSLGLADISAEQARGALQQLRRSGHRFPPRVPEICNATLTDRDAPSWTEAHALLFDRPDGVIHARIPRGERPVGEQERWALRERAMHERAATMHPMIAAFTAAYGARRLEEVSGRIAYGEYAAVELERLRDEWEDFVERAEARRREGMPLLTAPLARRELAGPRRLDPLAHLGAGPEDAP